MTKDYYIKAYTRAENRSRILRIRREKDFKISINYKKKYKKYDFETYEIENQLTENILKSNYI